MREEKFRELIIDVCYRSQNDPNFGAVKFNKLLFYIDLEAYAQLGHTISGQKYWKLEHGPAPKQMLPVMRDMQEKGEIKTDGRPSYQYMQKATYALREPNRSVFSADELAIIELIIERYKDKNATEMKYLSHEFIGWKLTEIKEVIPFETVFISNRPLTTPEITYGKQLVDLPEYQEFHA